MPAYQLGPAAAALVHETSEPMVTILQLCNPGVVITGRAAIEQLRDACNLALDAYEHKQLHQPHPQA